MIRHIVSFLQQLRLQRKLLAEERVVLAAVREVFPAHPRDVMFFVREEKPLLPVKSSVILQVWGTNGDGPWVHLSNLAGFHREGMTLEEIKETQLPNHGGDVSVPS